MRAIFLASISCLFSMSAHADSSAKEMLQAYDKGTLKGKASITEHLRLIEMGMAYSNASLKMDHQNPLYCTPAQPVLTGQLLVEIVRQQLEKTPAAGNVEVGTVMMAALMRVFPCSAN
jgi:hypothetical protein